jgi:hypothetical protein
MNTIQNPKLTTKQLQTHFLVHDGGTIGNKKWSGGYVMVEDIDKEYCRLLVQIDNLVLLAAKSQLTIERMAREKDGPLFDRVFTETEQLKFSNLRDDIKSGKAIIVNHRLVRQP